MTEDKKKTSTSFTIPLHGCLVVILLGALCGIAVNECKRSQIRLRNDEIKHERFMDSIADQRANMTYVVKNQQQPRQR